MKKTKGAGTKPAKDEKPEAFEDETVKTGETKAGEDEGNAEAESGEKAEAEAGEAGSGTAEETGETEEADETGESGAEDEALMAKYQRLMADFQNYKRRTEKEKNDIYAYANEKLILGLLEVIDNFERAVLSETADEKYAEGMEMIFKQLKGVLEKSGLEEIKALGEGFDPNFHNAVMTEDNDQFESGSVTEVLQKGYTLNGKVIRPSMVKVNN
ncbi:MAG TPA: nucleotide exchange factor GrpE [Candidatus Avanaerovorax faecigallinarum]|nr:nucleotide exchange factor GrpE [Candidatus Avanaerovorax faecigallinarum]